MRGGKDLYRGPTAFGEFSDGAIPLCLDGEGIKSFHTARALLLLLFLFNLLNSSSSKSPKQTPLHPLAIQHNMPLFNNRRGLSDTKENTLIHLSVILPLIVVAVMTAGDIYFAFRSSQWKAYIDDYMHDDPDWDFINFVLICCLAILSTLTFFGLFLALVFFRATSRSTRVEYGKMLVLPVLLGLQSLIIVHTWRRSNQFAAAGLTVYAHECDVLFSLTLIIGCILVPVVVIILVIVYMAISRQSDYYREVTGAEQRF